MELEDVLRQKIRDHYATVVYADLDERYSNEIFIKSRADEITNSLMIALAIPGVLDTINQFAVRDNLGRVFRGE